MQEIAVSLVSWRALAVFERVAGLAGHGEVGRVFGGAVRLVSVHGDVGFWPNSLLFCLKIQRNIIFNFILWKKYN